ncbi:cupin domain-containing protein [Leucobacter celer]|uniref:cupin domain-containing protein n=1 Tax=Leucobacter celer TaxID=668625 RepID=UPI0006A75E42|nr:cupin domain-containing protein [Leucobacter celer]
MPAIHEIQTIGEDPSTATAPALSDYQAHSKGWAETEFPVATEAGVTAGRWTGEPGWVEFDSWPYREFCVILEGRVAVESRDGTERFEYGPGEAFTIPQGFNGRWVTLEPTRKVFIGIETH